MRRRSRVAAVFLAVMLAVFASGIGLAQGLTEGAPELEWLPEIELVELVSVEIGEASEEHNCVPQPVSAYSYYAAVNSNVHREYTVLTHACTICGKSFGSTTQSGAASSHSFSRSDGGHSGSHHRIVEQCGPCGFSNSYFISCSGPPCIGIMPEADTEKPE